MAKNVQINGVDYAAVASVKLPLTADPETFAYFYDTDSGDAAAGDIVSGKKAWVDGSEITGTIPARSGSDLTVSGKTVTVPAGHYAAQVEKSVADGSATPNAGVTGAVIGDVESSYPITISPKTTVNTAGYIAVIADGAQVTKYVQAEVKDAAPTTSAQAITPTAGKLLSKVNVAAVSLSGTAAESEVLAGKTFYNTTLKKAIGTLTVPSLSLASGVLTIA